jgi:hypothetical protein
MAAPFGSVGHLVQLLPQAVASSLAAQLVVPHLWYPLPQVKSQVEPSQVVWLAPFGLGQAPHNVPHELTLLLSTQTPLQLCVPVGHPPQTWPEGMQAPLHRICPVGHIPPHFWPSQVAVPPVMF